MHFVPEDRRRRGVWRSSPQGSPEAVELRLIYLEFELESRLLAHERALRKFLWDLGRMPSRRPGPPERNARAKDTRRTSQNAVERKFV
jgi:hypothetical protein